METIVFSQNWNNKLNCLCFTTIRLRNDRKYRIGEIYKVILRDRNRSVEKGDYKLINALHLKLNDISDFTARLDTGYGVNEFRSLVKTMYKNFSPSINWSTQELSVLLLGKMQNQNTLL